MRLRFGSPDVARWYERHGTAKRHLGDEVAVKLVQRLNEIAAMPNLAGLESLPALRLEETAHGSPRRWRVAVCPGKALLIESDEDVAVDEIADVVVVELVDHE